MQLRSGKALSKRLLPLIDNVNPQNNPQNVVQQPVVSMIKEPFISTLVRTTAPVVLTTLVTAIPSQGASPSSQLGNHLTNPAIARPLFGFSMPPTSRDYPYGMPMSMMANLQPICQPLVTMKYS